ncbi:VpsF family polysaccharide biosynthesis protein [Bradyrhizobium sp. dw_78]|uniref:VpsF family polysaccharide biosynthesis protein n=1 Tax=Bradyrhizobium sp. dw_78 TaxID=2719793 RepID=UPI00201C36E3|nr:VpsF family polysaccharide biosynthesis protein [Bradyrhizobium sp. dw_78]
MIQAGSAAGSAELATANLRRGTVMRRPPGTAGSRPTAMVRLIDRVITGLMLLAVTCIFTVSSAMLTNWKIHYLTAGGNFNEKLHPATYFTFLAFFLLLIRDGDPIGGLERMFSGARIVLVYLLCWLSLLVEMLVLERPFTVIIDTFLLPPVLCLVIWRLAPVQRKPLVWALHVTILLNIVLGYYEYFSGHRLIPLTLGDVVVLGEWRSSALLGHPLTASGVVAGYILALVFRPAICPPAVLRLALVTFSLASLMVFGGRTALVTVLSVIGCAAALGVFRVVRGGRVPLPSVIAALCLLFVAAAAIFAALDVGFFDKMLLRFSSDKGSTFARFATFDLLTHFDWNELVLGPNPVRVAALQNTYGLKFGIEDFWVSCILQFGIIHTILLSVGLTALFTEILRRASGAAWAILLLILTIAASSVSFSSKNIQLAQFIVLITLFLPRERVPTSATRIHVKPRPVPV